MNRSVKAATRTYSSYVTVEHLLYALLDDEEVKQIISEFDVEIDHVKDLLNEYLLEQRIEKDPRHPPAKTLVLERVFNRAFTQTIFAGRKTLEPRDLFVSIMSEKNTPAYAMLTAFGVSREQVINKFKEIEAGQIPWTKESVIQLYDQVCGEANKTFEKFMHKAFHCPKSRAEVIAAGREIVAESGLYITKKRYAALIYDDEGERKDVDGKPGKVKAMGLDLKRSDTPVFMQDFLSELLLMVLQEKGEKEILDAIAKFRTEFKKRPGYEKGSPKRANRIGDYQRKEQREGKANMPGHVRASINWNTLKRMNGDKYSQEIVDGMKVIVCKLKQNPLGYTSVAYPTDELRLPEWFKELPFDGDAMESTIIDNKLDNLIGVLNYDVASTLQKNTFNNLFDFGGTDES